MNKWVSDAMENTLNSKTLSTMHEFKRNRTVKPEVEGKSITLLRIQRNLENGIELSTRHEFDG